MLNKFINSLQCKFVANSPMLWFTRIIQKVFAWKILLSFPGPRKKFVSFSLTYVPQLWAEYIPQLLAEYIQYQCINSTNICSPIGSLYPIQIYQIQGPNLLHPNFPGAQDALLLKSPTFWPIFLTNLSEKHKIIFLNRINLGANSQKLFPYPK